MSNDVNNTPSHDEARQIIDALRQIQNNPELRAQAETDPEGVMSRVGLSGIARKAAAVGVASALLLPLANIEFFW